MAEVDRFSVDELSHIMRAILGCPRFVGVRDYFAFTGGVMPYVVHGKDSERLHSDVDICLAVEHMSAMKKALGVSGDDRRRMTFKFPYNGGEIDIDIFPYEFVDGNLHLHGLKNLRILPGLSPDDFIKTYDGLRAVRTEFQIAMKSPPMSLRNKDKRDVQKYMGFDYDNRLLEKIKKSIVNMVVRAY